MENTITINVIAGREYLISSSDITTISIYYNGMLINGVGSNNRFIALSGVNKLRIVSSVEITSSLTITEYIRNFYDINDAQASVVAFKDKWVGTYGFMSEWVCSVGNRIVSFLNGVAYIHNGENNNFFGQTQDSIISFAHNEAGNTIKTYETLAIEGDRPDRVHIRTEIPNEQSSDLIASDFEYKEGVLYSPIYRDRLSPNIDGTPEMKLLKGDRMRGELAKFQVVFSQPINVKELKFVNINYDQSRGHSV